MDYLYFTDIHCARKQKIDKTLLNVNYEVKQKIDGNEALVSIITDVKAQNDGITLSLTAIGKFTFVETENVQEESIKNDILKYSTVTIIMPYIRSQVSILTTQPDLTPILLQPVDVTLLMAQQAENM